MPTYHRVKILPWFFRMVITGEKTFEIRINDRHYKMGDCITLCEWKSKNDSTEAGYYTGREATYRIGTVINIGPVQSGYVVFSLINPKIWDKNPFKSHSIIG